MAVFKYETSPAPCYEAAANILTISAERFAEIPN